MNFDKIIDKLKVEKFIILDKRELDNIIVKMEVVEEKDTMMSGFIRLLKYDNLYLVQEITEKEELILRLFPAKDAADKFIESRMVIYEQMWDGCGCKVNYYN